MPTPSTATIDDRETIIAQLRAYEALTGGVEDNEAYLRDFSPDAVIMPPGSAPIRGLLEIERFYTRAFGSIRALDIRYEDIDVRVQGSMAARSYTGTSTLHWSDSRPISVEFWKYLDVLTKSHDGRWLIEVHMWNDRGGP